MNRQEYKALTTDLLQGLEKKMLEIDGDIRFEQVSDCTWFIFLSDGTVNGQTEVFEYYNDSENAKWKFRGFEKRK